jgi:hypothetical protein
MPCPADSPAPLCALQALFPGMWPEQEGQGQLFEQLFSGPNGKGLPDGIPASAAAAAAMSSMKQEQQGSIFGSGPLAGSQQGLDGQLMQVRCWLCKRCCPCTWACTYAQHKHELCEHPPPLSLYSKAAAGATPLATTQHVAGSTAHCHATCSMVPCQAGHRLLSARLVQAGIKLQIPPAAPLPTQEFEFSNLEFLKPTRMNKVYIVFACNILDQDLLWCVYNIPTVGICRAEQRVKACQKLGITMSDANGHAESQVGGVLLPADVVWSLQIYVMLPDMCAVPQHADLGPRAVGLCCSGMAVGCVITTQAALFPCRCLRCWTPATTCCSRARCCSASATRCSTTHSRSSTVSAMAAAVMAHACAPQSNGVLLPHCHIIARAAPVPLH